MLVKLQPQQKIKVDGVDYIVQLYSPTFGLTLYAKLIRLLGQPVIKMLGKVDAAKLKDGKASADDLDLDGISEAIGSLFSQLKDDDFVPLIQEILSSTFTPNLVSIPDQFDALFAGQYNHVFKLVAKTLGAQYPNFLSGIVKRANGARTDSVSKPEPVLEMSARG